MLGKMSKFIYSIPHTKLTNCFFTVLSTLLVYALYCSLSGKPKSNCLLDIST